VITTAWPEFKKLTPADLKSGEPRPAIIDCWRVLPANLFAGLTDYFRLGYGGVERGEAKAAGADASDSSRADKIFSMGTD
jgi:UDPglucose 6-dehydrogenase